MKLKTLLLFAILIIGLTACNSANKEAQQLETALFEEKQNNREHAIKLYEEVVSKYPGSANAKVAQERLHALNEKAFQAGYDAARRAMAEGREPPPEPMKSYAPSIALYQRLITGFPDYRFTHGIYYLLAYCLGEMGQGPEAQVAYQTLIERYPDSAFVPEAWVRLGDWHFDEVAADSLQKSAQAFSKMYAFPEHPLYARAIYKLGWTYYRMDDFQNAVESFTRLLDHYVGLAKTTGEKPWPLVTMLVA